ncbi:MAG: hypothetical protein M3Y91_12710 [Actinomycetota bacterium]|nr:hypothetical protein [Actinomycetota bacterium]
MRFLQRSLASTMAAVVGTGLVVSCAPDHPPVAAIRWVRVADRAFGSPAAGLQLTAVAAPSAGQPWLVGGDTLTPDGVTHVGVWTSPSPTGPWRQAAMNAAPDRDGPYETILGFARSANRTVALGSRNSPEEGYPRPSTWTADGPSTRWQETLASRELFGGPDIVALGAIAAGPHGYSVAGTWVSPYGHPGAAVWRSTDGMEFARDDTDPALAGGPGETPLALDVADNRRGILVVGSASAPKAGQAGHVRGAIWYSPTGASWQRLFASDPDLDRAGQTTVSTVRALGDGWLAAGTTVDGNQSRPMVWSIDATLRLRAQTLPAGAGQPPVTISGLAVSATIAVVAGVGGGRPVFWTAPVDGGRIGRWASVGPEPGPAPAGLRTVSVAAGAGAVTTVLSGPSTSQVWVFDPRASTR